RSRSRRGRSRAWRGWPPAGVDHPPGAGDGRAASRWLVLRRPHAERLATPGRRVGQTGNLEEKLPALAVDIFSPGDAVDAPVPRIAPAAGDEIARGDPGDLVLLDAPVEAVQVVEDPLGLLQRHEPAPGLDQHVRIHGPRRKRREEVTGPAAVVEGHLRL